MKSNLYLCAFASDDLNLSVKRFMPQAQKFNAYKEIKIFRQSDLSEEINNRIHNFKNCLEPHHADYDHIEHWKRDYWDYYYKKYREMYHV